ncbi:hypothetical protein AVEN_225578-1 [Araneus ventricosus]|uniref:Uncharacterized protein n=1 Tax=Araneus ventricosus TaxID=182803 RepID=A0A4Y2MRE2_ARAVE|nr:hypothetical protein AVEN_225578-1 [Araneus ventricosus]
MLPAPAGDSIDILGNNPQGFVLVFLYYMSCKIWYLCFSIAPRKFSTPPLEVSRFSMPKEKENYRGCYTNRQKRIRNDERVVETEEKKPPMITIAVMMERTKEMSTIHSCCNGAGEEPEEQEN